MWRLFKLLMILLILAGAGLVAYAYLGPFFFADDFAPPVRTVEEPVDLGLDP